MSDARTKRLMVKVAILARKLQDAAYYHGVATMSGNEAMHDAAMDKSDAAFTALEAAVRGVVSDPGCFDTFGGSQEELDELIAEGRRMFASGAEEGIDS